MARPGRKAEVMVAAVTLFSQKGYHGTTVRDIAEESGMHSGSLYAHISSKEELLYDIVIKAGDQFMGAVGPIVAGPGPAKEKLRRAMVAHLRVVSGSLDAAKVFLHEWKALSGTRREEAAERRNQYEELLALIIRQGVAAGEFQALDEKFARLLLLSSVNWIYQWYNPVGPLEPDAVADKFADLLLEGFLAKKSALP